MKYIFGLFFKNLPQILPSGQFSLNLEIVFFVFMKKNAAIIIEHELLCNVPGIRTTTIHGKGYACSPVHRDQAAVDGRRSQPSAEKVPVRVAGHKRWRLTIRNTYTAVPGTRISGTRHPGMSVFFSAPSLGELGVAGERTSRTSPQTFEQSSKRLSGDGHLP